MMNWKQLLSTKRFGMEDYHQLRSDDRSEFQRDYDRLVFSAPFRRLQNKTQVFPLPGSVFVHNRLTHSLEVSCVGRSIGYVVSDHLKRKHSDLPVYIDDLGTIVSAACLAHDLGNPPFGHSGEEAIATYFSEGRGVRFKELLTASEWADFTHFEGNANAFRLLTHQFEGRRSGGFALTYSTLASIIKYPYEAQYADPNKIKFGFFQTESEAYERIAHELGIDRSPIDNRRYMRHPLVYLVEAADDICYQIMDLEDALKLKLFTFEEAKALLYGFMNEKQIRRSEEVFAMVHDTNEQVAYLRSIVIGTLIEAVAGVFVAHEEDILNGVFERSLIHHLPEKLSEAYKACSRAAVKRIYGSSLVLDVELSGYKIILQLVDVLMEAVFNPEKSYSKQLLQRIPSQYYVQSGSTYGKIQAVLDYVSGMTDVYALDLYRKINGMSLPTL